MGRPCLHLFCHRLHNYFRDYAHPRLPTNICLLERGQPHLERLEQGQILLPGRGVYFIWRQHYHHLAGLSHLLNASFIVSEASTSFSTKGSAWSHLRRWLLVSLHVE